MKTIIILSAALLLFSGIYRNTDSVNVIASQTAAINTLTEWAGNHRTITSKSDCSAAEGCSSAENIPIAIWGFCFCIASLTGSRRKILSKP